MKTKEKQLLMSIVVTSKCVANCEVCITKIDFPDLPTSKAKKIIKKMADNNVELISFSGREPFLRKDIFELISYTKNLGASLVVDSLNREKCKKMNRFFFV
jgi:MoaA/NifB/PqqE/SkfB family radical SAM enzyme